MSSASLILTELLYGPFTVMLTLIPFVMIRGAHLPTLVAGLAFIPLRVLIAVLSPLAGMRCRRFGRCLPLFAGGAVVTVALAAIGRDMRLSPLELQWVMNAELLPLAALTLVAGALGDRLDRSGFSSRGSLSMASARPRLVSR